MLQCQLLIIMNCSPFISTYYIDPDDEALTNNHRLSFIGVPLNERPTV